MFARTGAKRRCAPVWHTEAPFNVGCRLSGVGGILGESNFTLLIGDCGHDCAVYRLRIYL
jgi:hypothetical protein